MTNIIAQAFCGCCSLMPSNIILKKLNKNITSAGHLATFSATTPQARTEKIDARPTLEKSSPRDHILNWPPVLWQTKDNFPLGNSRKSWGRGEGGGGCKLNKITPPCIYLSLQNALFPSQTFGGGWRELSFYIPLVPIFNLGPKFLFKVCSVHTVYICTLWHRCEFES